MLQSHFLSPQDTSLFIPTDFGMTQDNMPLPSLYLLSDIPTSHLLNPQSSPPLHDHFTPQPACLSSNSTSDEAEELQVSIIDERRQRRMISNRESARRSRMRKQKHLDELWSQVLRLRTENHQLIKKLNHVSESHDRVVQENSKLKEEASDLRLMVSEFQIESSILL